MAFYLTENNKGERINFRDSGNYARSFTGVCETRGDYVGASRYICYRTSTNKTLYIPFSNDRQSEIHNSANNYTLSYVSPDITISYRLVWRYGDYYSYATYVDAYITDIRLNVKVKKPLNIFVFGWYKNESESNWHEFNRGAHATLPAGDTRLSGVSVSVGMSLSSWTYYGVVIEVSDRTTWSQDGDYHKYYLIDYPPKPSSSSTYVQEDTITFHDIRNIVA